MEKMGKSENEKNVFQDCNFWRPFGKIKGKQRNQNFTKEFEKIVIRKLGYRKDSYSKTGVQTKNIGVPKKM
jgi:hypothetical protein